MDEAANIDEWEEKLDKVRRRIDRLGPINLAAIDEFKEQSERKEYLDSQLGDLNDALETLEGAIRKIDRETRTRFRETYNNINDGFQTAVPETVRRWPRIPGVDGRGSVINRHYCHGASAGQEKQQRFICCRVVRRRLQLLHSCSRFLN